MKTALLSIALGVSTLLFTYGGAMAAKMLVLP